MFRVFTIILLFVSFLGNAQSNSSAKKDKKQKKIPENIEPINSKFSFAPFYVNEYSFLSVGSQNHESEDIYYKPNIKGSLGAKVGIKNINISYAFKLPQTSTYGNTQLTNLVFNFQKRIFGFSLYYIRYKGLYLKNPDDFGIEYDDDNYPTRPDIKLTTLGFQTHFIFTKSFSINAAFQQNERQKKTAGSFMIMLGDRFTRLEMDSSLIVESERNLYDETNNLNNLSLNTLKIAPGVGYSFIFKHNISFSTILLTGFGFQMKFYQISEKNKFGLQLPFYVSSKSALGYNGKYVFCNLIYNIELNKIKFSDSKFTLFANFFKLSLGFRIY